MLGIPSRVGRRRRVRPGTREGRPPNGSWVAAAGGVIVSAALVAAMPSAVADPPDHADPAVRPGVLEEVLFEKDTYGYECFRIPAIVKAADGTLLAFAEGRRAATHTTSWCNDQAPIDLVVRRLSAGGQAWSEPIVIASGDPGGSAQEATRGNPAPVVVEGGEHDGRIVLLSTHNPAGRSTPRTPHVQYSDDNGLTWSDPISLEDQIDHPDWGWYATGPVHAIQLTRGEHTGRLVSGINVGTPDGHRGGLVYSDDAGATWHLGAIASGEPDDIIPQEVSVVELVDGRIYAAARQNNRAYYATRAYNISADGGESFASGFRAVPGLTTTPAVQGATLRLRASDQGDRYNRILLSSPVHANLRMNMTVFSSFDEGRSWRESLVVTDTRSGYSDMVSIRPGRIGLLYEGGAYPDGDARDEIRFATFSEAQLGIPPGR